MKEKLLRVYSIIVLAICAFTVAMYLTQPFFSVKLNLTANEEMVKSLVGNKTEEFNINISEVLDEGIEFEVKVEIKPNMLFKSLKLDKKGVNEYISNEIIAPNIDGIVDSAMEPIRKFAKKVIKSYVTEMIKEKLGEQDLETSQAVIDAVDMIMNVLTEKKEDGSRTTAKEFGDTIVEQIDVFAEKEEYQEILADWNNTGDSDKEEIKQQVVDILNEMKLVDEETGEIIDMSAAISALLMGLLNSEDIKNAGEQLPDIPTKQSEKGLIRTVYAEESNDSAELKQIIKDNISNSLKIDETTSEYIYWGFKGITYFFIFLMATWAWVIIKIIFKLFSRNPGVKVWLPFVFGGGMLGLLFFVLPYVMKIEFISNMLASVIPKGFSFVITSSTVYALFAAVALAVMVLIFGYARKRRKLRRELRAEKKSKTQNA